MGVGGGVVHAGAYIAPRLAFVILKYCRPLDERPPPFKGLTYEDPSYNPGPSIVPIIVPDPSRGPPLQSVLLSV